MRVKYNPDRNLAGRTLRALAGDRDHVLVEEICSGFGLGIVDVSGIVRRLEEADLVGAEKWPLRPKSWVAMSKHDLVVGKDYDVLSIESGSYRIVSEGAEQHGRADPYLYKRGLFSVADPRVPAGWVVEWIDDDFSIHLPGWGGSLFCDYFEGSSDARAELAAGLQEHFPESYERWSRRRASE